MSSDFKYQNPQNFKGKDGSTRLLEILPNSHMAALLHRAITNKNSTTMFKQLATLSPSGLGMTVQNHFVPVHWQKEGIVRFGLGDFWKILNCQMKEETILFRIPISLKSIKKFDSFKTLFTYSEKSTFSKTMKSKHTPGSHATHFSTNGRSKLP
jgi:hypothetical protein